MGRISIFVMNCRNSRICDNLLQNCQLRGAAALCSSTPERSTTLRRHGKRSPYVVDDHRDFRAPAQGREMTRLKRPLSRAAGFTLIETLIAMALMSAILAALSIVTAQWLPNWNRG